MAGLFRALSKTADDGSIVHLYRDAWAAWFVGSPGDESLDPYPMGAFESQKVAQHWADEKFSGGNWSAEAPAPASVDDDS